MQVHSPCQPLVSHLIQGSYTLVDADKGGSSWYVALVVVSVHGPSVSGSGVEGTDMWLGAGLFPCLSISTTTVFSTVPYQRGDGECVEHDILSYS